MRVAHIVGSLALGPEASSSYPFRLSKAQRVLGVSAEIVVAGGPRWDYDASHRVQYFAPAHDAVEGVPVHRLAGGRGSPGFMALAACLETFDIVHVHDDGAVPNYIALTRWVHGVPLVLSRRARPIGALCRLRDFGYPRIFVDGDEPQDCGRMLSGRRIRYLPGVAVDDAEYGVGEGTVEEAWAESVRSILAEYEQVAGLRQRCILGVRIRSLSSREGVARIDRALDGERPLRVCFANAHTLNIANRNSGFRNVLADFLVLNDGVGANIASLVKFGRSFATNLNGTDFVPYLLGHTRHRLRIYLVGAQEEVVARAAARFGAAFPAHAIVGWRNGYFDGPDDIARTIEDIRLQQTDCVLVGMGNPLQEFWIAEHGDATEAKLLLGVGALFDFQAGRAQRAPGWVRRVQCEWIYRLILEPRRLFRRYVFGNFVFLGRVLGDVLR